LTPALPVLYVGREMGGKSGTALVLGGALLAAAALPGAAQASTIFQGGSYIAFPGEANQITLDKHESDFTYTDPGAATIDPGDSSCNVVGSSVTCPWFSPAATYYLFAGDEDDSITDTQYGHYFEIDGGPGDDRITASEYLDVYGNAGNDEITGGSGNDWLIGGRYDNSKDLPDNDRIYGLGGHDYIYGGVGDDIVDAGDGSPATLGGGGTTMGGDGNDVVRGGSGDDYLDGPLPLGQGRWADGGSDTLDGGEGDDWLVGSHDNGAPDTFSCGPGTDMAEVGLNDQVSSDCEKVVEDVGCPGPGGCTVDVVVSATGPSGAASSSAARRHGRKVILGARKATVNRGASKALEVRLDRGRLSRVLRGDGKAKALLAVTLLKKKGKPKRSRTPFGLSR
jgi:Ca2+-binding RTX toxin-like protein